MMADAKAVKWSAFAIIALVACAGAFLLSSAADDSDAASSDGTAGDLTWTLDDSGVLSISGTGAMPDYSNSSSGHAPWYDYKTSIKSVTIADGVTNIGAYAFSRCTALTSVTIPSSVTSIGDYAFNMCTSLASITIPSSVTSIGESAFGYSALTSVTIPSSVTSIGESAFSFSSLTSVTIPSSVTSIGDYAFASLSSLISADIQALSFSSSYGIFSGGRALTNVTLAPTIEKVPDSAFRECTSLTSIAFASQITTYAQSSFSGCTALTSIVFADNAKIGAYAFKGCTSLTSITIPDSVTSIGNSAFSGLSFASSDGTAVEPTAANLAGAMWLRLSTSGPLTRMISSDGSLTWTLDDSGILTISGTGAMLDFTDDVHAPWYGDRRSIKTVSIADGVTNIGAYAFNGCTSLTSITIPDSVTKIGDSAFSGLSFAGSDGTAVEPTAATLAGAIWTRDSLSDPFMAHVWIHIHEDADISGASASILQVVIVLTLVAIVLWIAVDVLRKRYD